MGTLNIPGVRCIVVVIVNKQTTKQGNMFFTIRVSKSDEGLAGKKSFWYPPEGPSVANILFTEKNSFWYPHEGPGRMVQTPRWYGRLRVQNSMLLVLVSIYLPEQSFHL